MSVKDSCTGNHNQLISDFIKKLENKKVKLWLDDESLRYKAPKGVITGELLKSIGEKKEDLIRYLKTANAENIIFEPIGRVEEKEYYPLSAAQTRMFILNQIDKESTAYNITNVIKIDGEFDKDRLTDALRQLVNRHESLRTSFETIDGTPIQRVRSKVEFDLNYSEIKGEDIQIEAMIKEFVRPYELTCLPLFRIKLLKVNKPDNTASHFLFFDIHHIISDGVSASIIVREINELYAKKSLPELNIQYKDYVAWHEKLLSAEKVQNQKKYWIEQLEGELPVLNLPTDYPRPSKFSNNGESVFYQLDRQLTDKLNILARENRVTLFTVLFSAYFVLMQKYSGQDDIIVGTPTAGRVHEDIYSIVGVFVNTLAIRNRLVPSKTFTEFLKDAGGNILKAFDNQDYPFDRLVEDLNVKRDASRNAIFNTLFVLQNIDIDDMKAEGMQSSKYEIKHKMAQFDITVNATENKNGIDFEFNFCTDLFNKVTIERFGRHLANILEFVVNSPKAKLSEIDMLAAEEKEQILDRFNNTISGYQKNITLQELFEKHAERTPDNTAIVFKDKALMYGELNEKANKLARALREKGVKANDIIGILAEPSLEMIVAIFGILKAGGAYMPINTDFPEERIKFLITDSGTKMILTQKEMLSKIKADVESLDLKDETLYEKEGSNIDKISASDDLAYVIYTSGTTGNPKGVLIEHESISKTIQWRAEEYKLSANDSVLQLFSYSFDGFLTSFFTPVLFGSKVILLDKDEVKDPAAIRRNIIKYKVTHFISVPVLYSAILEGMSPEDMKSLRIVTLAGEKAPSKLIRDSREKKPDLELVNEYGPTESSVVATLFRNMTEDTNSIIGRPAANTKVLIFSGDNILQPVGVPGELCICGDRLARGYLNRPELTKEKFIQNPFNPSERMYKSGDLAKWLPDGNIAFVGRIDHQVKIRGFRIELAEIELEIQRHEAVKDVVVLDKSDAAGNKYICSYIVPNREFTVMELKEFLSKVLPGYMIPAHFIKIEVIPVTSNGKVDRAALPGPDGSIDTGVEYVEPANKIEKELERIWEEVLGIKNIGVNHNFFDIGGDSIRIVTLHSKIDRIYPDNVTVTDLFSYSTISKLAAFIESNLKPELQEETKMSQFSFEKEFSSFFSKLKQGLLSLDEAVRIAVQGEENFSENVYRLILENSLSGRLSEEETFETIKTFKYKQKKAEDIAIIGMAVNLPLSKSVDEFWKNISNKVDCIGKLPENRRLDADDIVNFRRPNISELGYEKLAYIDEIDKFDYNFFRITPKEASLMDPNQRLFLQTAWGAIEDAGYGGDKLKGTRTGVYVGFSGESEYGRLIADAKPEEYSIAVAGNLTSIIASRISYILDLKGPSVLVNTACSSSLVAIHNACRGISDGECNMAVAGGVKVYLAALENEFKLGIESADSRTKSFDDDSDGTARGEGVVAIFLKPLKKAVEDRDPIYAVIKGSSVNQDGTSNGITAPSPVAQAEVIRMAWENAKIDPETIEYIEAHGTGTKLGDPIEIDGIHKAFRKYTMKNQFCAISSVKSNMGHLDNTAGVVGFIKAALALKNLEIPPALHFNSPNKAINFINSPVYVNDRLKKWDTDKPLRRCGVSSFGLSGTNCHIVLEEAPVISKNESTAAEKLNVFTISAKSKGSLSELVDLYKQKYSRGVNNQELRDLCYTLNTGRGHYNFRVAIVLEQGENLIKRLDEFIQNNQETGNNKGIFYGEHIVSATSDDSKNKYKISEDEKADYSKKAIMKLAEFITGGQNNKEVLFDVCELYIKGADIGWETLYQGEKNTRVNAPTYPFSKQRCWIKLPSSRNNSSKTIEDSLYFTLNWEQKELSGNVKSLSHKNVLVFADEAGSFDDLISMLEESSKSLIKVSLGEKFKKADELNYIISDSESDYIKLCDNIKQYDINMAVHLLSVAKNKDISSLKQLEERQESGVFSLLYFVKAIQENLKDKMELVLISDNVNEVTGKEDRINPQNAILFGIGKSIGMECPDLKCRLIDIDENTDTKRLIEELESDKGDYQVAYRNDIRYIDLIKKADCSTLASNEIGISSSGVYVITGGTGRLGLEFGKHLASKGKVNLALVNRSTMPDKSKWDKIIEEQKDDLLYTKIKTIRELENTGAKVAVYACDITSEKELEKLLSDVRYEYGRINGIIHCAAVGVGGTGAFIFDESKASFRQVLLPKVEGTWLLDKLTRNDDPDFFIMYSSAITVTGGFGFGSYIAANAYLDSYAMLMRKAGRKALTVNWPPLESKELEEKIDEKKIMFKILPINKAMSALDEVLAKNISRVIIGELNVSCDIFKMEGHLPFRLSDELKAVTKQDSLNASSDSGKNKDMNFAQPRNETEKIIAELCQEVLGFDRVGIHDDFFELGGHSLLAVDLISKLGKAFKKNISLQNVFENPSVAKLAEIFMKEPEDIVEADVEYEEIEL
jgi:amino acid adenylation domain-containing protein